MENRVSETWGNEPEHPPPPYFPGWRSACVRTGLEGLTGPGLEGWQGPHVRWCWREIGAESLVVGNRGPRGGFCSVESGASLPSIILSAAHRNLALNPFVDWCYWFFSVLSGLTNYNWALIPAPGRRLKWASCSWCGPCSGFAAFSGWHHHKCWVLTCRMNAFMLEYGLR